MLGTPEERVCLEARRHGIVLARPLARAAALALGGGLAVGVGWWPLSAAGVTLLVVAAALALRAVWGWDQTQVVVTTEKLFIVTGTFRRRAAAVRLAKIGSVEVEQSLLGRLLGYGTIVAGDLEIRYVPAPRRVYGLVERLGG
jgi:uncharacterized membrane protein YdbT with pleckstrin-like domain